MTIWLFSVDDIRILAVCPAYNESGRIGPLLEKLIPLVDQVCVVDDGSTDNTHEEANQKEVIILKHSTNRGKGAAIRTGIKYFMKSDFDIVLFIDGDGQHSPLDIRKFRRKIINSDAEVFIASRFGSDQWINNMPFLRKISNLLSRFGIWVLYNGLVIEDPQNGYRAYRREAIENIECYTTGYEAETEILIDAYIKGFEFDTVHIESIYDGHEHSSKFSLLMDTWRIPGIMVKLFFRRKPFLLRSKRKKFRYRELRKNTAR